MSRLQQRPSTRNAFFGDTSAEVAALLASWERPWWETSVLATCGTRLVGFLGAELDDSLGRAWLHGPAVDAADWDSVADALLAGVEASVPGAGEKDQELAGDTANERLAGFAARHGFAAGKIHEVLALAAAGIERLPAVDLPPLDGALVPAFLALHERLFPGTYYSGRQLLDLAARGEAVVLGLGEGDGLVGYVAGRIDESGNGYVDFVGVAPEHRRLGHGRTLVVAVVRALNARAPIEQVRLTVSSENAAALRLYQGLGFARRSSLVDYRRLRESAA